VSRCGTLASSREIHGVIDILSLSISFPMTLSNLSVRLKVSSCLSHKLLVAYTLNHRTDKFLESVARNEKVVLALVLAKHKSPQCGACSPQISFI